MFYSVVSSTLFANFFAIISYSHRPWTDKQRLGTTVRNLSSNAFSENPTMYFWNWIKFRYRRWDSMAIFCHSAWKQSHIDRAPRGVLWVGHRSGMETGFYRIVWSPKATVIYRFRKMILKIERIENTSTISRSIKSCWYKRE